MKVIELLNKIANGEEVPKKIRYNNETFTIREEKDDYVSEKNLFTDRYSLLDLNEEVEIIEEDKKIKQITIDDEIIHENTVLTDIGLQRNLIKLTIKINEIIDYLNKEE